jgi:hypothetical protein
LQNQDQTQLALLGQQSLITQQQQQYHQDLKQEILLHEFS